MSQTQQSQQTQSVRHAGTTDPAGPASAQAEVYQFHPHGFDAPNYGTQEQVEVEGYDDATLARLRREAAQVAGRYPQARSALLPLLHLVQSYDGYVTTRGLELAAEFAQVSTAEAAGVATFYTQYKRHPNGRYLVGVCTNTLCAIMGGDQIWDELSEHLDVGHDETTEDGVITLERIECNAACDYAPVVMANWEFFDNMTPESAKVLVDDLRAGRPVRPTRGPDRLTTFTEMSRVLAGFTDGLADQGPSAGAPSLLGLGIAREQGWDQSATDGTTQESDEQAGTTERSGAGGDAHPGPGEKHSSAEAPAGGPASADEVPDAEPGTAADDAQKGNPQ